MNKHMTNEELKAIRERVEEAKSDGYGVGQLALRDVPKLLAEIERLRSGLEALDKDISACLAYKLPFELIEISGYIDDILHGVDSE